MGIALGKEKLKQIPLFAGLSDDEFKRLEEVAAVATFEPGEFVIEQDQHSQHLWVLLEGRCEVIKYIEQGKSGPVPTVLAVLSEHSNFGEMSFFHDAPHSAAVRAQTRVKLLHLTRAQYNDLVNSQSSLACKLTVNVVQILAERLRRMDQWVVELKTKSEQPQNSADWSKLRSQLFDTWQL
ncbi:MAG TPA: cyclic nucleotide-binding domain-containing protein [Pirellulales bacterium]